MRNLKGGNVALDTHDVLPADVKTVNAALQVLQGQTDKSWFRRVMPFLGPSFVAAVAYIDPGNFATNIQGGAQFGYQLLWVIVASNLMAMLIQTMSSKLGIATGKNLAEVCRDHFSKPVVWGMWGLMEVVAIATDLAEFLGAALGFNLLLHVSLLWGAVLTAIVTFAALGLQKYGFRPLEALIAALVGVVAGSYGIETLLDNPSWGQLAFHAVVPQFSGVESLLLATGILGATVMPHVIFLHSGLTQDRIPTKDPGLLKRLFRYNLADVAISMTIAGLVNGAMLVMAAATFHQQGMTSVGTIEEAHKTLAPLLGQASQWVFAISLLASGLSSTIVGTMSGQVIMQGFLHRQIPMWVRRAVTMLPSFIVIFMGLDPTRTLVLSQVVLSFGIPFALIPLLMFTQRKDLMGILTNKRLTSGVGWLVAGLIVVLNLYLLYQNVWG